MRKICLDKLPHIGSRIDWRNSIGYTLDFVYGNICGSVTIINYLKNEKKLKIKYNNIQYKISSDSLAKCALGKVLKTRYKSPNYKYHINDIIKTKTGKIKIIKQIKINQSTRKNIKGYEFQCLKDGYIGQIREDHVLRGVGCPICCNSPRKIVKSINDLWTTNPEIAKLLANPEDGYKYTYGSSKKVNWKCPNCGTIVKNKAIYQIVKQGLSCPCCSDGIKYPEKFMYNLLNQFKLSFIHQYSPEWIGNCRYDFYIPSKKIIIEMDGGWHKEDNKLSGQTAAESKEIDDYKSELAQEHGVQTIRIECGYEHQYELSRFEYVKKSILNNTEFCKYFDISYINWIEIERKSQSSIVKDVCDYFYNNPNLIPKAIGKVFNLGKTTILKYLKQGTKLGWCNYDPKKNMKLRNIKIAQEKVRKSGFVKQAMIRL